jgi:hypothetical protein
MKNDESRRGGGNTTGLAERISSFGFCHSFVIGYFVIRHFRAPVAHHLAPSN